MAAIGCLFPFVLLLIGVTAGGAIGGATAGLWGGAAGFVVGLFLMLAVMRIFKRAKRGLPE